MPTLTNQIRKEILAKLMSRSDFAKRREQLLDEEHAIGDKFVREAFTDKDWKLMTALPFEYFEGQLTIRLQVAGTVTEVRTNRWRRPDNMSQYKIHAIVDAGTPRCIEIQSVQERRTDLRNEEGAAHLAAENILNSCTTTKALIQAWPEIKSFVEPYDIKKDYLPAVIPQAINGVFKLPVEEKPAPAVQGKTAKTPKGKRAQKA